MTSRIHDLFDKLLKFFEGEKDITLNCDENSSAIVITVPANKETSTQEGISSEIDMDCDGVYSNGGSSFCVGFDDLRGQQQEQEQQQQQQQQQQLKIIETNLKAYLDTNCEYISKAIKSSAKNTSSLDDLHKFCGETSLEKYYDLTTPLLKLIVDTLGKNCDLITKLKAMEQHL